MVSFPELTEIPHARIGIGCSKAELGLFKAVQIEKR
jgi:hypothetical protein